MSTQNSTTRSSTAHSSTADIPTLIDRYLAAWNEPDATARRALLQAAWEENGAYTDPMSQATGRAELDALIGSFHARNPGAKFTLPEPPACHHNYVRFFWQLHLVSGAIIPGMDYGEVSPSGKLSKIVGFF